MSMTFAPGRLRGQDLLRAAAQGTAGIEVPKGCFDFESPPGGGTRVHASISLGA